MPGLVNCHGHSPMTLVRSAGDGLPLDRWLTRVRLAARGAADRRGRLLGHDARRRRAAGQRHHDDLRAVPPSRRRSSRPCSTRASGPSTRPAIFDVPERRGPGSTWEALLAGACALFDAEDGKEGRLHLGFGPHAAYTVPPEGLRAIAAEAQRRDALLQIHLSETAAECDDRARALRHERARAAGRRSACSTGASWPRTRCGWTTTTSTCWRTRRGGGALPGLQREARARAWRRCRRLLERGRAGRARHRRPRLQRRPAPVGRDAPGGALGPRRWRATPAR